MALTAESQSYLDHYLRPLRQFFDDQELTDIHINRPLEVWTETLGGQTQHFEIAEIDEEFLWRLARQIASHNHQGISRRHPLLAGTLPDATRVQIVAPPATRGDVAIAFRKHRAKAPDLSSYRARERSAESNGLRSDVAYAWRSGDPKEALKLAVSGQLNIVVSGGTSTGKTTLLNALLEQVPTTERIITIEDTPELKLVHQDSVGLLAARGTRGEADVTITDLLESALRMRPDRILLGELRGAEAFTFLRAINTGHPGSMTTLHADSPDRALTQLAMMSLQARTGISFSELRVMATEMVDLIVQLERDGSERRIAEIVLTRA